MRFFSDSPYKSPDVPPPREVPLAPDTPLAPDGLRPLPNTERPTVDRHDIGLWRDEELRPDITRPPTPFHGDLAHWGRPPEPGRPTDVPVETPSGLERFVRDLKESIPEAVIWRTVAIAADTVVAGGGLAVKTVHAGVGLLRALESLDGGRGFDVRIPIVEVAGGLGVDVRIRECEAEPPSLPSVGLVAGWAVDQPSFLNAGGLDRGGTEIAGTAVILDAEAARSGGAGRDIVAVARYAREHALVSGARQDPLVLAWLNLPERSGGIVVDPGDGRPYCPVTFEFLLPDSLRERLDEKPDAALERIRSRPERRDVVADIQTGPYTCPCCGYRTLARRGAYEQCDECDWVDDGQDEHDVDEVRSGPNGPLSLSCARAGYVERGGVPGRHRPPRRS